MRIITVFPTSKTCWLAKSVIQIVTEKQTLWVLLDYIYIYI